MTLKQLLQKSITIPPDIIQFAKDRKYEEAWIIPIAQTKPPKSQIESYLTKEPFQTIIVEYIWDSQIDNKRFVLTLFLDDKCQLQDPNQFINLCLDLFYSHPSLTTLIETLNAEVIGHSYLFESSPESVNMSIFNYWLSVGPVELWEKGDKYDPKIIAAKIQSRPDIATSKLNYQGLLFRFNISGAENGPLYGLKTPCCTKQNDTWTVDFRKVNYWMPAILGHR